MFVFPTKLMANQRCDQAKMCGNIRAGWLACTAER
jgi:hypothetical protein